MQFSEFLVNMNILANLCFLVLLSGMVLGRHHRGNGEYVMHAGKGFVLVPIAATSTALV